GSEFGDAARRVAAEYGDTIFVVSSGEVEGANVASLKFDLGEAAYLAGMAAAALSKTGKAGQIGGQDFPPVKQAFELFTRGGRAINPNFTAPITYLGNWSDANAAKEQALGFIRAGADVLFQNADAAGEGVFLAAEENKAKGVLVIGSNANQNSLKPDVIAASAVLDVAKTFMSVARDVQGGKFKGGFYQENLASGNVYLALNSAFEARIPAEVRKKMQEAEAAIRSGSLKLTG
ncbi:MAG: BMP family ABC transporter substrate-binding protein, partial [Armatimonadetes bacterium]|nr:BMP family ABC transporter substrate-binding protein [Armatimonadota bacterium]